MKLTKFIIPSVGRDTLDRTLVSLINQKKQDWSCVVVFDDVDYSSSLLEDKRIETIKLDKKHGDKISYHGNGGKVRNFGLETVKDEKWISFVDDDDFLMTNYIDDLVLFDEYDIIIHKAKYIKDGIVLPRDERIYIGNVGIFFSVKSNIVQENNIRFENGEYEDINFLIECTKFTDKIYFNKKINYIIG